MKYKNNTDSGVVIPYAVPQVEHKLASTGWIKFHPGETKEVPNGACAAAEAHGLTKVGPAGEVVEDDKHEVKAMSSKVGKKKVETKQLKKRK